MGPRSAPVAEIAPDTYRLATYHEPWRSSVNQYLIVDEEPVLVSTGLREHFEATRAAIAEVLDPTRLRHVVVPHFEADECGALNEILTQAPHATTLASMRTVLTSLADFALRPPRVIGDGEVIATGRHALRVIEAPYVHAWDGLMLLDEATRVLFSADLFSQPGMCEPITQDDRASLSVQLYRTFYGQPPPAYLQRVLDRIEAADPAVLAPGHGSALAGNLLPYYRALRTFAGEPYLGRAAETAVAAR
jgi:flavorubredoxin